MINSLQSKAQFQMPSKFGMSIRRESNRLDTNPDFETTVVVNEPIDNIGLKTGDRIIIANDYGAKMIHAGNDRTIYEELKKIHGADAALQKLLEAHPGGFMG